MGMKHLFIALALAPLAVAVAQADQLSDIMAKKSLSCGVYADVPPFSAPDPTTRELVGMDVDLCKALAKTMGVALELKPLSVEARIPEVKMGRVDVIFANLAYTKTRATEVSPLTSSVANSNWAARSIFNPNEDVAATSAYQIRDRVSGTLNFERALFGKLKSTFGVTYEGRR
eukprot:gene18054-25316_t